MHINRETTIVKQFSSDGTPVILDYSSFELDYSAAKEPIKFTREDLIKLRKLISAALKG